MNKVEKIVFKKINRISPSQFFSMKNCAYKSLLAEAFEKKPLLPVSPNAYFGKVLHKMLELISKGIIRNETDFNRIFDEQINLQEEYLKQNGSGFIVPLQNNVKDFGLKKILLKKHLRNLSTKPISSSGVKFLSEKWLESKDKLIVGKIDLVVEAEQGAEIIDFKTGAITEDILDDEGEIFSDIKEEYREQLKLYAYLYFETNGKFPIQLSLIDLAKQKFIIDFTESECNIIYEQAKELLKATNESIRSEIFVANPSKINCKYCLYRPACSFFLKHLETDYSFNDVSGLIINVVKYQNGNVSVFLESGEKKVTITGFPAEKYHEFNDRRNEKIFFFNLRKEVMEYVYSATKTTKVYE